MTKGGAAYSPEIINQHVKHGQQQNQQNRAPLGLEADDDHDAGDQAEQADHDAPEAPLAGEDEADEQEDQQHAAGELDVHLAVLLVELGQAGGDELLADPRVREHHEQPADDAEVAQEEVQVEDQAVAEALDHDDGQEAGHGVLGAFAGDDECRADGHGNHVDDEEAVCYAPGDWRESMLGMRRVGGMFGGLLFR